MAPTYYNCGRPLAVPEDTTISLLCDNCSMFLKKKESEMGYAGDKLAREIIGQDMTKGAVPVEDQIDLLLKDRGTKYGSFDRHAQLTQGMFDIFLAHMQHYNSDKRLTDSQREALHMIFHKLGRIGNGDPNYMDSWTDIAGYAKLVADEIENNRKFNDSK